MARRSDLVARPADGHLRPGSPRSVRWAVVSYSVQTPVFEGPFDLLLHLILRDQVELYEINLSQIVDAYLSELDRMEHLDLDVATEFLLIAATLVEMKARRLVPGEDDIDLDDELSLWEERDQLLARLLECKTFKDAARVLDRLAERAARSRPRRCGPGERFANLAPDILEGVTPQRLADAYLRALIPPPKPTVDLSHVAPIRISVVDTVAELISTLPTAGPVTFRSLTRHIDDRITLVVHFLAILEMFKQGLIEVIQVESFAEIQVEWNQNAGQAGALELVDSYEG